MLAALPFADEAEGPEMSFPLFYMTRCSAPAGDCLEGTEGSSFFLATHAGCKCDVYDSLDGEPELERDR